MSLFLPIGSILKIKANKVFLSAQSVFCGLVFIYCLRRAKTSSTESGKLTGWTHRYDTTNIEQTIPVTAPILLFRVRPFTVCVSALSSTSIVFQLLPNSSKNSSNQICSTYGICLKSVHLYVKIISKRFYTSTDTSCHQD